MTMAPVTIITDHLPAAKKSKKRNIPAPTKEQLAKEKEDRRVKRKAQRQARKRSRQ